MFFERPEHGARAVLVHLDLARPRGGDLGELVELSESADLLPVGTVTGRRVAPHPRWFVGEGKLEQLRGALDELDAAVAVFDHELSPAQQRNLERRLNRRVLTRTELILDIFAARARTHEGRLQVELAQLNHAQTRLIRGWTHLDRQKGGIGLRGAGETQLELDQRMLAHRIRAIEKKLESVRRRRGRGRRRRKRASVPTVALVGYTNAGKSTLFNALTGAGVDARQQLFATLDPTMRRMRLDGLDEVVLADTVGFIKDLPHSLVAAFKATLEEVAEADLLLHVIDMSNEDMESQRAQVETVLEEIGALTVPRLEVWNKVDRSPLAAGVTRTGDGMPVNVRVSALTGEGLGELAAAVGRRLGASKHPVTVVLDAEAGRTRSWLYRLGTVMDERLGEDGRLSLTVRLGEDGMRRLAREPGVLLQGVEGLHRIPPLGPL